MKKNIIGIGAYYNDDTEYGIQIFASKLSNAPLAELLIKSTEEVWKTVSASLRSGKLSRKNCVTDALECLVHLIPVYNMNMYGTYSRVMDTPVEKTVDKEFAQIVVTIVCSIKVLTELQAIPNDEYNGMLYFEEL
jgi:hypothetical protein